MTLQRLAICAISPLNTLRGKLYTPSQDVPRFEKGDAYEIRNS
jgi:hypothetical protein